MDKEKLLQLIHCKLKKEESEFTNLTADIGLVYKLNKDVHIDVNTKIKYRPTTIWERIYDLSVFKNVKYKIPVCTLYTLNFKQWQEDCRDYGRIISFSLTLDEFNEINTLIKERRKCIEEKEMKKLDDIITKELENCK